MLGDFRGDLTAIADLARASWALRDALLAKHGLTEEVVRLEDSAFSLEDSLAKLKAVVERSHDGRQDR